MAQLSQYSIVVQFGGGFTHLSNLSPSKLLGLESWPWEVPVVKYTRAQDTLGLEDLLTEATATLRLMKLRDLMTSLGATSTKCTYIRSRNWRMYALWTSLVPGTYSSALA